MDISELRKEPHLSASAINDYLDCGLLYKLGRVDKLPMEFRSDALEFGSTVHKVLEEHYRMKMEGKLFSAKELQQIFEKYWREAAEGKEDIRYSEGKDFETLLLEGKELLTVYRNKIPEDNFTIVGIEEPFSFTIDGCPVPIIGAADLIEEDESETLIITDWKTAGRAYSNDEVDRNFQLTIYQMAAKANGYSDREILLKFDCLIKTKTPKFEQYYSSRTEEDENRAVRKILGVFNGISRGVFIPNDSSSNWRCKNCPYQKACDDWFRRKPND
jgi:putative RecB family exonuclease